jgi:hypothetical protein
VKEPSLGFVSASDSSASRNFACDLEPCADASCKFSTEPFFFDFFFLEEVTASSAKSSSTDGKLSADFFFRFESTLALRAVELLRLSYDWIKMPKTTTGGYSEAGFVKR